MVLRRRVSCVDKLGIYCNAHERIQNIGGEVIGVIWKVSQETAIRQIESKTHEYYVALQRRSAEVIVASHNGKKYLTTETDNDIPENLLALPEYPQELEREQNKN
jgi:hypothetical protein